MIEYKLNSYLLSCHVSLRSSFIARRHVLSCELLRSIAQIFDPVVSDLWVFWGRIDEYWGLSGGLWYGRAMAISFVRAGQAKSHILRRFGYLRGDAERAAELSVLQANLYLRITVVTTPL